ncbi:serine/threonine-protein kinase [Phytomonospora endophytica]|uniref:non-specific serine/threonine protein kinase n=1 Tax=Phytomonospora endophytica TaxID=714109 RepID=A0A841F8M9_9ACTN|nr:serine/threonine-protein kinase [Phytomonospora endophytica]MBB6032586.1 serine/threonine protein kinase [Phytomonospora endophytica]GIG66264.1 hypothetical protein Pen01_25590 [Phytomonospora endophytica]
MPVGDLIVDRYRLDERIAAGGMGEVWRGTDVRLKRPVAIKMLHPGLSDSEEFRARFVSEATLVAALNTRGVAAIYDYGEEETPDGVRAYLVMELVSGRSLADVLRDDGPLGVAETTRLIVAAAEGLHAAHSAGIIHRDVKPANILITSRGIVKIIDFGIARSSGDPSLTDTGMVIGTVVYSAPEHLTDDDPTPAVDIYSLGIVAYECLTGAPPFATGASAAIMFRHLSHDPAPLPDNVPAALSTAIMKALRKDPADRWETVQEFGLACLDTSETDVSVGLAAPIVADTGEPHVNDPGGEEPEAEETPTLPEATDEPDADESPTVPEEPEAAPPAEPEVTSPPPAAPDDDSTPERPDPPTAPEGRRRRRLLVLACVVTALLLAGIITWQPWRGSGPQGGEGADGGLLSGPSSPSSGTGQQSANPQADGSSGSGTSPEGDDPTTQPGSTGGGDGNGDGNGDGEDGGGSDPGDGDGDDDPPGPATAKVPDLTGMAVEKVAAKLRGSGFEKSEAVKAGGENDADCVVLDQSPKPGVTAELSTTVTFYYKDGFPFCDVFGP